MSETDNDLLDFYSRLMTIDIKAIIVFIIVLETDSSVNAARVLRCSPSTISLYLKRAQRHMGQQLFIREGRDLRPTAYALLLGVEIKRCAIQLNSLFTLHNFYKN